MSDRVKLVLASLAAMMLPHKVGYSFGVLVLTALMCTTVDLAKQMFGRNVDPL